MYRPTTASFRASDMILEKNMGLPILQVESGQFSPTPEICIAVLHSRKLVVVILKNEGKSSWNYNVLYEHQFDRNAFNLVSGNFGKSSKTQICVQSVDGALFFFEHDTLMFQIQLPDFLIPGPLLYSPNLDSIVLANSNLELECYRFSSL